MPYHIDTEVNRKLVEFLDAIKEFERTRANGRGLALVVMPTEYDETPHIFYNGEPVNHGSIAELLLFLADAQVRRPGSAMANQFILEAADKCKYAGV